MTEPQSDAEVFREALAEALYAMKVRGLTKDADEIERRHELVFQDPKPMVHRVVVSDPRKMCCECGRDLHGYQGPRCRYCSGTAE